MTDYLTHDTIMTEEQLARTPDLLNDHGTPTLRIKVYFHKGSRGSQIIMTVSRMMCRVDGSYSYGPTQPYNGHVALANLKRKTDKTGKRIADAVFGIADQIAAKALESEQPNWREIKAMANDAIMEAAQ